MRKKRLLISIIIFILFLLLGYIFIKPAFNYLSGYLSKSEEVKANVLIVEGWLPDYALELAYKQFQKTRYEHIITTGIKSSTEYFNVSSNGYLIFNLKNKFSGIDVDGPHSIEIDAYSQMGGENSAHFNLFINDSLVTDFYAEKRKKKYLVNWNGALKKQDSIMIQFDNDSWGKFGDRNLFVKEIIIDHKITIPYLNNSVYAVSDLNGSRRTKNILISNAEICKKKLIILGIDSSLITAVSGGKVKINRTLTSALAFRDWLTTTDRDIKGINIISMGSHTRRTWMTYNRVLQEKYKIGIISLPDYLNIDSLKSTVLKTIRETLGIIYYWFILIPY